MASEIRVNKINSRTGVGTITLSPTGVDFTGIATVATLKATTGIVTTLTVTGTTTLNGNLDLQDNDKILVGTGDDLEIYHDGTDTWVDNTQGDLYLRTSGSGDDIIIRSADDVLIQTQASEGAIIARGDGEVELYHNNSKKLETTSTGVTITGTATATEGLVLDGQTGSGKGLRLDLAGSGDYIIQETTTDDVVQFGGTGASNFFVHNISSGRIGIGTASPSSLLHGEVTSGAATLNLKSIATSGEASVSLTGKNSSGTARTGIFKYDNSDMFRLGTSAGIALRFETNDTERMRILSGGGLTFNGDTATANALDDYEEGESNTTITNITADTNSVAMKYTKVGSLVTVVGVITLTNITSSSSSNGNFNLPFTPTAYATSKPGADIQMNTINTGVKYLGTYGANPQLFFNTEGGAYRATNTLSAGIIGFTLSYTTW